MNIRPVTLFARGTTLAFLAALPFGTKKYLASFPFSFSNVYVGEYVSAFLFGTDVLLLAVVAVALSWYRSELAALLSRFWQPLLLVSVAALSLFAASYPALGFYALIRLALAVAAAFSVAALVRANAVPVRLVLAALAASGVVQAALGIAQFLRGGSVGLTLLGEPVITEVTNGVARILIGGGEFLRALGTMPHANILAGFLVLGLGALYYLFLSRRPGDWRTFVAVVLGTVAVAGGLIATFSRSGWITALVVTVLALAVGFRRQETRWRAWMLAATLVLVGAFFAVNFGWAIAPRAGFVSGEGSVAHRHLYNLIGLDLVRDHPLGVGVGNQLLTAVDENRYVAYGLPHWWEWQPIHNLYLMVASETGVFGVAVFILFLVSVFRAAHPFKKGTDTETGILAAMLIGLLIFGLFDHFLWDLQSGRLLLWVVLGILMGASVRSSTLLRTSPHSPDAKVGATTTEFVGAHSNKL